MSDGKATVDDEGLVEAAKALRPYLAGLIGTERAPHWDTEVAELLAGGRQDRAAGLRRLVESDVEVLQWVEDLLDDPQRLPPELQGVRTSQYAPGLGSGDFVGADRFVCPQADHYVRYRVQVGEEMGICPDHKCPLIRG